jgi:hypothetical protein
LSCVRSQEEDRGVLMEGELQMSRPLCVHHFVSEYGAQKLRECGESRATRLRDLPIRRLVASCLLPERTRPEGIKSLPSRPPPDPASLHFRHVRRRLGFVPIFPWRHLLPETSLSSDGKPLTILRFLRAASPRQTRTTSPRPRLPFRSCFLRRAASPERTRRRGPRCVHARGSTNGQRH